MNNKILMPLMLAILLVLVVVCFYIIKTDKDVRAEMSQHPEVVEEEQVPTEMRKFKYDISHLTQTKQIVWGPIQDDEALLLFGLVKAFRPKTIVEFGMGHGPSSLNFLKALDPDGKMYTYDIEILNANAESFKDPRFKFIPKSQTEFNPADFDNRMIDIAYLDNGHYFEKEKILWPKLIKQMSPNGIMIVHDTGLHANDIVRGQCACDFMGSSLCGVLHCAPERQFVNWISENYPEYQIINVHCFTVYRHGLTIIQKKHRLSVEPTQADKCTYA